MSGRLWTAAALCVGLTSGCGRFQPFHQPLATKPDFNQELIPGLADRESTPGSLQAAPTSAVSQASLLTEARNASSPETLSSIAAELNQGHAEARQNNLEAAKAHYRRVLELQPDHSEAHHRLAIIADKQQDFGAAEHHYLSALRSNSGNADLLSDLGYSYFLQRRHRESQSALEQALRINPSHSRALNNLGLLYGTNGNYDGALAVFRRVGSEADAQNKIAKLFPQGPPKHAPQQLDPDHLGNQMLAEAVPMPATGAPAGDSALQAANAAPVQANVPTDLTLQIKEEMERARLNGISERRQERLAEQGLAPAAAAAPRGYGAVPTPVSPAAGQAPRVDSRMMRTRIPDGQINHALARIDSANGPRVSAPPQMAAAQMGAAPPAVLPTPSQPYATGMHFAGTPAPRAVSPWNQAAGGQVYNPAAAQTALYQQPAISGVAPATAIEPSGYQIPVDSGAIPFRQPGNPGAPGMMPYGASRDVLPGAQQPLSNLVPAASPSPQFSDASRRAAAMAMDPGMFPMLQNQQQPAIMTPATPLVPPSPVTQTTWSGAQQVRYPVQQAAYVSEAQQPIDSSQPPLWGPPGLPQPVVPAAPQGQNPQYRSW